VLLYNLSFPNKEICDEQELYFRGGESRDGGIFVKSGDSVTFDTYFNCFSHIKYKKYTQIKTVTFKMVISGSGVLSIYQCTKDGTRIKFAERNISGEGEISVDITTISDNGFLYGSFIADGDAFISSGGWYTEIENIRQVKIGIVICTYRREVFVKRNIRELAKYIQTLEEKFFDVFVVDNGRTLDDCFGENIKVIPNENTGGSGGFTRGIKEVCEGNYTHFLLMDDDILFDANILQRTFSMLSVLKSEFKDASVGGAMLVMDKPYMQLEMGADWNGTKIISHRKRVDVRKAEEIVLNEEDGEFDYNGWFYTCMPTSAVEKFGYPLPFFIKCDDLEYGLRAAEHFISSSGIAVWHEDFDIKYVPGIEYYINRNELILTSRFPKGKGVFSQWEKLVLAVGRQLMMQRYYSVDLIFKAYEDFFKGAEWFLSLDSAKYHNELKKYCPQFLAEVEIKKKYGVDIDRNLLQKHKKFGFKNVITLNGYLLPKCFYSKETAQVDMTRYKYGDFYMKRRIVQFNEKTGTGFVTEIKKSELLKAWGKLIKYFFIMMFKYRKTAKQYAEIM